MPLLQEKLQLRFVLSYLAQIRGKAALIGFSQLLLSTISFLVLKWRLLMSEINFTTSFTQAYYEYVYRSQILV